MHLEFLVSYPIASKKLLLLDKNIKFFLVTWVWGVEYFLLLAVNMGDSELGTLDYSRTSVQIPIVKIRITHKLPIYLDILALYVVLYIPLEVSIGKVFPHFCSAARRI